MKQKIIQKIRECCPETMELSPNCFISNETFGFGRIVAVNKKGNWRREVIIWEGNVDCSEHQVIGANWKIIGHPLNLQHLLRAIGSKLQNFIEPPIENFRFTNLDLVMEKYNLEKSLEENLDNEQLCELLVDILNIK